MSGPAAPWSRQSNLPVALSSFVGRRQEMAAARKSLSLARLLTLTGPGGVGKTQLALRTARQVRRAFADGVWLVDLAALQDPDLLVHAVADALGSRDHSGRAPLAAVMNHLEDKQMLLVVDNCEHLLDACAIVIAKLLSAAGRLRVLATSRESLRVDGEHILQVGPLPAPNPELVDRDVLDYEAVRLFAERAAVAVAGFEVTADNQAAVAGICLRLDGMPLAIELAAARLQMLSPDQILRRLDDRFPLLVAGSRTALPRHRTLRATIDWSFELCSPEEQTLWARASVFVGGFDLDAAEAICAGGGIERGRMFDAVAGLVDKSILTKQDHGRRARYQMLDTLHQYGRDRLRETGEEAELRRRHRDYYLGLAERSETEWFGPDQVEISERTRREHANLRVAMEFCMSTPRETQAGLRLAAALYFYWDGCGVLAEGRRWLDRALSLDGEPTTARAKALWTNAHLAIGLGAYPSAASMASQCHELALRLGDDSLLAHAVRVLGIVAVMTDDHPRGVTLFEEALAGYDALGELNCTVLLCRQELAFTLVAQGRSARAVALCRNSIAVCERHGEQWVRTYALYVLAYAEWSLGEPDKATVDAREALRLKMVFHDLAGVAQVVDLLGWIAATAGDGRRAATLLGAVQRIWTSIGGEARFGSQSWIIPAQACERQARRALGDHGFDAAFARGSGFGLDEAVAYALGETPQAAVVARAESPLTRRERQVAELVTQGLTNKQIADQLVITQRTAEGHVERILAKLGLTNRTRLAAWMARQRETREE